MSGSPAPSQPKPKHPFKVLRVFFSQISLTRAPRIMEEPKLTVHAQVAFAEQPDGKYELKLRLQTPSEGEQPVTILVESVGLFRATSTKPPSEVTLLRFLNEHMLALLHSQCIQLIGGLTGQMGMPPIWLDWPRAYGLSSEVLSRLQVPSDPAENQNPPPLRPANANS
jgi:preprotein translocase subunit SecB